MTLVSMKLDHWDEFFLFNKFATNRTISEPVSAYSQIWQQNKILIYEKEIRDKLSLWWIAHSNYKCLF